MIDLRLNPPTVLIPCYEGFLVEAAEPTKQCLHSFQQDGLESKSLVEVCLQSRFIVDHGSCFLRDQIRSATDQIAFRGTLVANTLFPCLSTIGH